MAQPYRRAEQFGADTRFKRAICRHQPNAHQPVSSADLDWVDMIFTMEEKPNFSSVKNPLANM